METTLGILAEIKNIGDVEKSLEKAGKSFFNGKNNSISHELKQVNKLADDYAERMKNVQAPLKAINNLYDTRIEHLEAIADQRNVLLKLSNKAIRNSKLVNASIKARLPMTHKLVTTTAKWVGGLGLVATGYAAIKGAIFDTMKLQSELNKQAAQFEGRSNLSGKQLMDTAIALKSSLPFVELDTITGHMSDLANEGINTTKSLYELGKVVAGAEMFLGDAVNQMVPFLANLEKTGRISTDSAKDMKNLDATMGALVDGFGFMAASASSAFFEMAQFTDMDSDQIKKAAIAAGDLSNGLVKAGISANTAGQFVTSLMTDNIEEIPAVFRDAMDMTTGAIDFTKIGPKLETFRDMLKNTPAPFVAQMAKSIGLPEQFAKELRKSKGPIDDFAKSMNGVSDAQKKEASLQAKISKARAGLFSTLTDLWNKFQLQFTKIGSAVSDVVAEIFKNMGGTGEIGEGMERVGDQIVVWIKQIPTMKKELTTFFTSIKDGWNTMSGWFGSMEEFFEFKLPYAILVLKELATAATIAAGAIIGLRVFKKLKGMLSFNFSDMLGMKDAAKDTKEASKSIGERLTDMSKGLKSVGTAIGDTFKSVVTSVTDVLKTIVSLIGDSLVTLSTAIGNSLSVIFKGLAKGLSALANPTALVGLLAITAAISALIYVIGLFGPELKEFLTGVGTLTESIAKSIGTVIGAMAKGMTTLMLGAVNAIKEFEKTKVGSAMADTMAEGFGALQDIISLSRGGIEGISNLFGGDDEEGSGSGSSPKTPSPIGDLPKRLTDVKATTDESKILMKIEEHMFFLTKAEQRQIKLMEDMNELARVQGIMTKASNQKKVNN
jgi:ABC-type transporter Mla subunit MlaD